MHERAAATIAHCNKCSAFCGSVVETECSLLHAVPIRIYRTTASAYRHMRIHRLVVIIIPYIYIYWICDFSFEQHIRRAYCAKYNTRVIVLELLADYRKCAVKRYVRC